MDFVLWNRVKAMREHRFKWKVKTILDLHYTKDLNVLDENVWKMNDFSEILRIHIARLGLKINFKKTKLLLVRINEGDEVEYRGDLFLGRLSYHRNIISEDGGSI